MAIHTATTTTRQLKRNKKRKRNAGSGKEKDKKKPSQTKWIAYPKSLDKNDTKRGDACEKWNNLGRKITILDTSCTKTAKTVFIHLFCFWLAIVSVCVIAGIVTDCVCFISMIKWVCNTRQVHTSISWMRVNKSINYFDFGIKNSMYSRIIHEIMLRQTFCRRDKKKKQWRRDKSKSEKEKSLTESEIMIHSHVRVYGTAKKYCWCIAKHFMNSSPTCSKKTYRRHLMCEISFWRERVKKFTFFWDTSKYQLIFWNEQNAQIHTQDELWSIQTKL